MVKENGRSDELFQDKPIGSLLAQNELSQSCAYKSLDNSGISSLAKQDMNSKEGAISEGTWVEETDKFLRGEEEA